MTYDEFITKEKNQEGTIINDWSILLKIPLIVNNEFPPNIFYDKLDHKNEPNINKAISMWIFNLCVIIKMNNNKTIGIRKIDIQSYRYRSLLKKLYHLGIN